MAHVQKFTASASGRILKHFDRDKDDSGKYVKFGNIDIDLERTHLNYNLAQQDRKSIDRLRSRLKEVKVLNRPDVNVLCSWVVTVPKELRPERFADFFRSSYGFLEQRYGAENVISANVHLDETSPHMHFAFVPVVMDKNKKIEKVSAKERITRQELKTFHTDLQGYLERELGEKVLILTGATKAQGGNKSVKELKRESTIKKLEEGQSLAKKIKACLDANLEQFKGSPSYQMVQYLQYERQEWGMGQNNMLKYLSQYIPFKEKKSKITIEKEALLDIFKAAASTHLIKSFETDFQQLLQQYRRCYQEEIDDFDTFKREYEAKYTRTLEDVTLLRKEAERKVVEIQKLFRSQLNLNETCSDLMKENQALKEENQQVEVRTQWADSVLAENRRLLGLVKQYEKTVKNYHTLKAEFEHARKTFKEQTGQDLNEFHKKESTPKQENKDREREL